MRPVVLMHDWVGLEWLLEEPCVTIVMFLLLSHLQPDFNK